MGCGKVIHDQGQVELVVPEIVGLLTVPKPGELELMAGLSVSEKNEDEAPVIGYPSPNLGEMKGLLVETDTLFQIQNIEVIMRKTEFHGDASFPGRAMPCPVHQSCK
jgi:hypothetical protein